ncbi:D-serine ammonia-lyase [Anaerospora hongkongensis]|uniref:D-serine ammonia-lyase n=1 Tax=Anaerospora hongkongensis TaxID=244830 RepID=UPI002896366F|nr:D-serine ammonia-lyase [Anaerospora hongkongensis]
MENCTVLGKQMEEWKQEYPLIDELMRTHEVFWTNPLYGYKHEEQFQPFTEKDMEDAEARLARFAPVIMKAFPETEKSNGIIESPLTLLPDMQKSLSQLCGVTIPGKLWAKLDSHLPISGSIKARGGVYEVLYLAEAIAMEQANLAWTDDYAIVTSNRFRELFAKYTIAVGSTGNLGLSIGIMGAALGFRVVVHMSVDAKQWKKDMLRSKGVVVVEHTADYSMAVEAGRKEAEQDANSYFIDDESSRQLFLGYAVAAKRLQQQLKDQKIVVNEEHPLFVYLPCGVGGGPGGVTFGLKSIFKENVHCFFAEPTHSPAMLLGLMTGLHEKIAVQDFGIDNRTAADGLAVGRPSGLVGRVLERDIAGVFTVQDDNLYLLLKLLADSEHKFLEPSALAGFFGPMQLMATESGRKFLRERKLINKITNATHIAWATGGSMVPKPAMDKFLELGVKAAEEISARVK